MNAILLKSVLDLKFDDRNVAYKHVVETLQKWENEFGLPFFFPLFVLLN